MKNELSPKTKHSAFTLVEILASMAVFMLLISFVVKSVTDVSMTAYREDRKMEGMGEARDVLDRIGLDWAARVSRPDVVGVFTRTPKELRILSQVPGYEGDRTLAAVSYRINAGQQVLERGLAGYSYGDGAAGEAMTFPAGNGEIPFVPGAVPTSNYEALSTAVFHFDFAFIRKSDGLVTRDPGMNLTSPDCAGLVVSVVSLDRKSRQMLSGPAELEGIAQALPTLNDGDNAETVWRGAVAQASTFASLAGVPLPVAAALRVDQRTYLLEP